jgi:hypothetical protein
MRENITLHIFKQKISHSFSPICYGRRDAESGAIIEYLLDQYDTDGKLRPKNKQA